MGIDDNGRVHVHHIRTATQGSGRSLPQALTDMQRKMPQEPDDG